MNKLIATLFAVMVLFSCVKTARADNITLNDGTELKGKITLALDGIIDIRTDGGTRRITRNFEKTQPMDIVEVGIFHRKKIIGQVLHIDETSLHMLTPSGGYKVARFLVRNISLRQEPINKLAN